MNFKARLPSFIALAYLSNPAAQVLPSSPARFAKYSQRGKVRFALSIGIFSQSPFRFAPTSSWVLHDRCSRSLSSNTSSLSSHNLLDQQIAMEEDENLCRPAGA